MENEALELLVANITRMDEKEETESQAVYNTLSIFENLIELNPKITTIITSKTKIMSWLLNRVKSPDFDDNKLYVFLNFLKIFYLFIFHFLFLCIF